MKAKALVFISFALLLGFRVLPVCADGVPPTLPHAFYGSVTVNGEPAAAGTVVTAKFNGIERGSYTVQVAGQYGDRPTSDHLIVQGVHAGDPINFYINGIDTNQTYEYQSGIVTELDLSITITTPTLATNPATSITTTSATLNGNLSSLGADSSVTVSFEWGTTTGYDNTTTPQIKNTTGSFSAGLSGLLPDTTYHFRFKVFSLTTTYGADESFTTLASGSASSIGSASLSGKTSPDGVTTQPVTVQSEDGKSRLIVAENVKALDEAGSPLSEISVTTATESPDPPEDTAIIGIAYDCGPDGATFNPAIILELHYNPADIPDGVTEDDLSIAYYDKTAANWVDLESIVNTAAGTITTTVGHFTAFTIIAHEVEAPPAVAPEDFTISSLTISPREAAPGEKIAISISIDNPGSQSSKYKVTLKINSLVEAISSITIAAGENRQVSFETVKDTAGSYSVDINGLMGSFSVKEAVKESPKAPPAVPPPAPAPPPEAPEAVAATNWFLIGGIIGGVIVLALIILFLVRRASY